MLVISHRGNQEGPISNENDPYQLVATISAGFNVEVDIWYEDGKWFLGHDNPEREVPIDFLLDIREYSWYHCKNLAALNAMTELTHDFKYFWHQEDQFTLTSNGYIWTYPGQEVTKKSIIVDLDLSNLESYKDTAYAVCTDYPRKLV